MSLGASDRYYKVAKFPTRNIKTPIVLIYGGSDSLVDINVMLRELPKHTVAKVVPHFEHLDFLWAHQVETLVFPYVFDALEDYAGRDHLKENELGFRPVWNRRVAGARGLSNSEDDVSSVTAGEASDLGPEAARNLIKKRDATPRKGSSRILRSGIPRNKEHKGLSSSSSTNPLSMSSYGESVDSPARLNHFGPETNTRNEHRRSGSLSSTKSLDVSKFGERGISVGAGKAIVGGVNSPGLQRLSDMDVRDSPKQ